MSDYNGWTNRDTWLVVLWLTNDEPLCNQVRLLMNNEEAGEAAQKLVLIHLLNLVATDHIDYENVNWGEVLECLRST